ncbi:4'-phosphopantetheinyl transferase [Microbacterium sp. cf046]|uniref:4'-phosphopantetheinyl transferase family protein n=1 Tax=Microbacterium sp. cf046 TaxID=1761803 RepID=UPI0008EDAB42|nr:hypothetical protein [Microbacterium sp. cf046]SFR92310.1 4'-phosphopantetheinyl transferase [Microbacterium sp. cf046]
MVAGRAEFGPVRIAWIDAAASAPPPSSVLQRLGEEQVQRHERLHGIEAQRFLAGRWLLVGLIAELTDVPDVGFTTTCERCGAEHGRPRLEKSSVAVSVSYAGSLVAVAAARQADAAAVGVDIEPEPNGGAHRPLQDLAALFAPAEPPDTEEWTVIEAALKADGSGLAVDLSEVRVGAVGGGRTPSSRAVRIPQRAESLEAETIPGPAGFVLSVAMAPATGGHPA